MGSIDDLANRYVAEWAPLTPTGATYVGIAGYDDKIDDLSPEGFEARAELVRRTIAQLDVADPESESEHVAKGYETVDEVRTALQGWPREARAVDVDPATIRDIGRRLDAVAAEAELPGAPASKRPRRR